jgi:HTH-type transcriptional regulator / antitoxin HigA
MLEWEQAHEPALEPITVAQTLQFLMDQHGLTQSALAAEMGVTQSHISKVLSGERAASKELAKQLGRRFNMPSSAFIEL